MHTLSLAANVWTKAGLLREMIVRFAYGIKSVRDYTSIHVARFNTVTH